MLFLHFAAVAGGDAALVVVAVLVVVAALVVVAEHVPAFAGQDVVGGR